MTAILDPFALPPVYVDGLEGVEIAASGNARLTLYAEQRDFCDGDLAVHRCPVGDPSSRADGGCRKDHGGCQWHPDAYRVVNAIYWGAGMRHVNPKHAERLAECQRIRSKIEAAVARLIDALDAIDGPGEDLEPSLAGFYTARHVAPDAEEDAGDEGELDDEGDVLDLGEVDEADPALQVHYGR